MFYFSALIYNGYYQQLVTGEFGSESDFMQYLDNKFGVYVCLWHDRRSVSEPNEQFFMISPCLAQCKLDEDDNCTGCFRSREEIMSWTKYSDAQRDAIMARVTPVINTKLTSNKNQP